ncbi:putative transcription factor interactor and regulator CCHC(Zn) family [Rosa chinensis]|uniref:Putative transcription factor interactor and regulator CCHC(Zn) family n=1 Tax=Rosa chinensis TaxID=74649 RepID=A0A2P6RJH0_ROSCH|nr:putative transcription factor interactor and regulator CCHC(Zn) family [Rosa chinensis]
MGKKRKLGQREAAQSQVAEPIVISVDDAGKPFEPLKEIGIIQANVLPNPNEVAVNAAEHPGENPLVPEIEGKSEPVEPRKTKKKKHKPIDTCVDVAGKRLEPLKEVGLMQANPAELPPTNPTIEAKSGAELSSNPVPEIEAKPAELPPLNTVTKDGVISKEPRMNPDPNVEAKTGTEEVTVKKKKKKKNKKQKLMESQSTVTTCVDNVEKNGEAKIDEEDVPPKMKKKKNKKQKLGEMRGTVITCVDNAEKNGEAKIDEEDVPLKKKKKKNKKQKLGEMPGTVITCVDDVEKSGEARVDGQLRRPGPVVTEVKGAEGTVIACVNGEGKISEGGEVGEQVTMPGLIQAVGVVENKKSKKSKRKGNKEMESTDIACVNAGKNVELLPNPLPDVEAKPGEVTPNADAEGECKKVKRKKKNKRKGAEEKPLKQYVKVCVICRGKGHIISTCPLLSNKISGNKLSECPQLLQDVEMKSGEAEKLLVCPPEDTLMQDKSSDRKEGESIVKNGEEEKFIGCPSVDALMKEETSGGKEDESAVKNAEESSCTPEDIFMKDEKSDDKEDETIVKIDSASHPEESYVKPMIERGPEVVYPVA